MASSVISSSAWVFVGLTALNPGHPSGDGPEELLKRVIDHQEVVQALWKSFAHRESIYTKDFRKDGSLLRGESEAFFVTPSPDGEYRRLLSRHGRPLEPGQSAKEERRFRAHVASLLELSAEERRERNAKHLERRVKRYRERLSDALEVFEFRPEPDESIDGIPVRVFSLAPKPGYKGKSRSQKILSHMEGRVWIDARRNQLARLELRARDDIKLLAGIFGRVSKGSEARAQAFLDEDVWLLDRLEIELDARLYFFKGYRRHIVVDYEDYERYSVTTEEEFLTPSNAPRETDSSTSIRDPGESPR